MMNRIFCLLLCYRQSFPLLLLLLLSSISMKCCSYIVLKLLIIRHIRFLLSAPPLRPRSRTLCRSRKFSRWVVSKCNKACVDFEVFQGWRFSFIQFRINIVNEKKGVISMPGIIQRNRASLIKATHTLLRRFQKLSFHGLEEHL